MKSIEQFLKDQESGKSSSISNDADSVIVESEEPSNPNSDSEQIEAVDSTEQLMSLIKEAVNIHWQQSIELTNQGSHLKRWGYSKLGNLFSQYGEEERQHATIAVERLEFFDSDHQPITITPRVWKRHDIKSIIEFNLQGVMNAAVVEKAVIKTARDNGDEITAQVFIPLLKGSDDGIAEFERMLKLIQQMGMENFLTLIAAPTSGSNPLLNINNEVD